MGEVDRRQVLGLRLRAQQLDGAVESWRRLPRPAVEEQAERLAAFRDVTLTGVDVS
jgi:hypothetical protein